VRQPKEDSPFVEEPREKRAEALVDGSVRVFKDKSLVRVHAHPTSDKSVQSVMSALETHAKLSEDDGLDVWDMGAGYVDIMISQEEAAPMLKHGHHVETLIGDIQALVDSADKNDVHPLGAPLNVHEPPRKYLRHADLHKFYKEMATELGGKTGAKWIASVGKSSEGRDIGALRFGGHKSNDAIFFQAGIHAREWISPSTVLHVTHKLLTSKDPKVRNLVDNIEFIVVPSLNPDGYEYTHQKNRLWRKNRGGGEKNLQESCKGVDLNRNWDDHWGQQGCSHNPCSEVYAGSGAFSEKETQVARDFLLQITQKEGKNLRGAIDWHSYSQIVLRPYDWAKPYERVPQNEQQLLQLGQKMADLMSTKVKYSTEHASELYRVAGSSMAWQYSVPTKGGAAFTIELRDKGDHGFVLPASLIQPTAEEAWPAVQHFAETLVDNKFEAAYTDMITDHLLTENDVSLDETNELLKDITRH
jgi:murein tripeptide amidase MpaA